MRFKMDSAYKLTAELQDRWRNRSRALRATLIGMNLVTQRAQR